MEAEGDVWASAQVAACSTTAELSCACSMDLGGASVWGRPLDLKVPLMLYGISLGPQMVLEPVRDCVPSFAYVGRSALAVDPVTAPGRWSSGSLTSPERSMFPILGDLQRRTTKPRSLDSEWILSLMPG
ncbi:hypothetical protein M514_12477 [Trichuris suis]|uniref:Uncharacterized protein n=1 Tax=Trichuris suis TaxID=68888 RepID=A0A085N1J0_9BILA|nr:hypothetical protein M514_12477 [Trichuris suis]